MFMPQSRPPRIIGEQQGPEKRVKQRFPLRFGRYLEIRTQDYEFCFTLNGEIKTIRGLRPDWPHPAEQFKRTMGNDWVYYTVGDRSGDAGIVSWTGEYYLPCLPYPSNPVWEISYFSNPVVMAGMAAWQQLYADLYMARAKGLYQNHALLVDQILAHGDQTLHQRAGQLNQIIGERVSVLPPDTRHVDYDVIPLTVADGCRYQCKFCCVKSENRFRKRSRQEIQAQIDALTAHFSQDLTNYHGLFLGNHDALSAGRELVCEAAQTAYERFGFRTREGQPPFLFLFASVKALLDGGPEMFAQLNQLPFHTYVNVGFESLDPGTLAAIGKPITPAQVREAFNAMLEINSRYERVEVTGNFVIGQDLPPEHNDLLTGLLTAVPKRVKGAVYLSPLMNSPKKRELLRAFHQIREKSGIPVFTYLIQRL